MGLGRFVNDRMQRYRVTIEREDFRVLKNNSTSQRWDKVYEQTFDQLNVEQLVVNLNDIPQMKKP